jgi:hypothetical protein
MQNSLSVTRDSLPALVNNLRRLLGFSFREMARSAEISSASNVREWVCGFPARLREERIQRILTVVGLDAGTGRLSPGIHRWNVGKKEVSCFIETIFLLFPDKVLFSRARSGGALLESDWLFGSSGAVRILVKISGVDDKEIGEMMAGVASRSYFEGGAATSDIRLLSSEALDHVRSADLSVPELDRIFLSPVMNLAKREGEWTYEHLFERLWAEGIEPDDAARRLGLS